MPITALTNALQTFQTFAAERRIPVVPGYVQRELEGAPLITFLHDEQGTVEDDEAAMHAFVQCMAELDVGLATVWVTRLTESEWQDAVDRYQGTLDGLAEAEASGVDVTDARGALRDVLAEAQQAKAQIGEIAMLEVTVITRNPTTVVRWFAVAPWHGVIGDAAEQVEEIEASAGAEDDEASATSEEAQARRQEWEERERERRLWTANRRTETARRLAESPDFAQCKREADRVYMLRKMLGAEAPSDDHMLKEMAREAFAIYRLEVARKS